jgi:hypothetical protein
VWDELYSAPQEGKTKKDIVFLFFSESEQTENHRSEEQQQISFVQFDFVQVKAIDNEHIKHYLCVIPFLE